jgi:hypothetical protein
MKTYIILLSTILFACSSEKKDDINITLFPLDSIKYNSKIQLNNEISSIVKILNEKSISDIDTMAHEFRCYYFPPFRENKLYFRLNYHDSVLTIKEFQNKYPDGSGAETLINSQNIQLGINDFKLIDSLITKSMFWSLENFVYPYISIDGETFIYECRQPMPKKITEVQKDYHVVKGASPKNFDFANLGQFFLLKIEHKNTFRNNASN